MSLHNNLKSYLSEIDKSKFSAYTGKGGGYITFENTGKPVKAFTLSLESLLSGIEDIENNIDDFIEHTSYDEKKWRDLGGGFFSDKALKSISTVQTKPLFTTFSKLISWANKKPHLNDNLIALDVNSLAVAKEELHKLINEYQPKERQLQFKPTLGSITLPKPFILLSGISGTGKTRFVKQQAKYFKEDETNYCLVPVRPDWHEPSDLLGYISRLGSKGAEYIVTDFLRFIVAAWKHITEHIEGNEITYKDNAVPYWLCLDEMNLAPVEQYFADYLSVIETRYWEDGQYSCDPLLNASIFTLVADISTLRTSLDLEGDESDDLWNYFLKQGICIPPNMIVAGTVNMDETTHDFSRKVIDRAFTLDFGEFFPNHYQHYFEAGTRAKALSFPTLSQVDLELISKVSIDADAMKSIGFLDAINVELKGSPFELAYRALNELLIAVVCFKPDNEIALQAVWDDFLMTKVLPRIEGDSEKLQDDGEQSLLNKLESILTNQLSHIWDTENRPDLLRENIDGTSLYISCRSKKKINWMKNRLSKNGFTSFWP